MNSIFMVTKLSNSTARSLMLGLLLLFGSHLAQAQQDLGQWWRDNVQWDGVTPWVYYIKAQPGEMGPNALPVPSIQSAFLDTMSSFGALTNFHYKTGDRTWDLKIEGVWSILEGRVLLYGYFIPVEYFNTSHAEKTRRHTFFEDYDVRTTSGDVYIMSAFSVWRKPNRGVSLRVGLKTASGGQVANARYTDTPGYYFDADYSWRNEWWQFDGMVGMYVWQTWSDKYYQDDALLYGAQIQYGKDWRARLGLRGYYGYIGLLDRPTVLEVALSKDFYKAGRSKPYGKVQIVVEVGDESYPFFSVSSGYKYYFN